MSFPAFELEITKDGTIYESSQLDAVVAAVPGLTDLIVVAHGWNNNIAEARDLYDRLFGSVDAVLAADVVPDLAGRRFGVVRVFWPSKRFEDADLIPGGGAAAAVAGPDPALAAANEAALRAVLEGLKQDPDRLGGGGADPTRTSAVAIAAAMIPHLDHPSGQRAFVDALRSLLDPAEARPDDGSDGFFARTAEQLFAGFAGTVVAPGPRAAGGASSLGGSIVAGVEDLVDGTVAAARRIANYATYYEIKTRAGVVGRGGVQALLRRVRATRPELKVHLIGHSFGGRLVTAAAHALGPATPALTVALLQAAFSHNGLASHFDGTNDGAFRSLVAPPWAAGPIVITHTKNDEAVGIAYPLASRLARQVASALGDEDDPYGGMGRNGAQHTPEVDPAVAVLQPVGPPYPFAPGKIYNLRADDYISGHSDVAGPEVAYALLSLFARI